MNTRFFEQQSLFVYDLQQPSISVLRMDYGTIFRTPQQSLHGIAHYQQIAAESRHLSQPLFRRQADTCRKWLPAQPLICLVPCRQWIAFPETGDTFLNLGMKIARSPTLAVDDHLCKATALSEKLLKVVMAVPPVDITT